MMKYTVKVRYAILTHTLRARAGSSFTETVCFTHPLQ